ncbi:hypothetical protein SAMN04488548_1319 [Gordonia westfalica]|uniref:Uncharacterized protein n=1 Tax=Gordonia westfalica TaxID=158898 RepID=A0A1H2EG23_9ACTN|nr:hypothetical protein SAMN04488548_1319 [Gordonia westfalica]
MARSGLANNADGSVRRYAQGGIRDLEQYANGKLPNQAVIEKARPNTLVQWAEPETGGEAFIPLAPGKRSRSTSILATVADMFGYQLIRMGMCRTAFRGCWVLSLVVVSSVWRRLLALMVFAGSLTAAFCVASLRVRVRPAR